MREVAADEDAAVDEDEGEFSTDVDAGIRMTLPCWSPESILTDMLLKADCSRC